MSGLRHRLAPLAIPVLAAAMDAVVDPGFAGAIAKLGGLAVMNLEGVQCRFEDADAVLARIAVAPKEEIQSLLAETYAAPIREELAALKGRRDGERAAVIREELADVMMEKCGVYRDETLLTECRDAVRSLRERYAHVSVDDKGSTFNTDLLEARELGYLLDCAETTVSSALARTESRGAHSREDFPERDDANFLKHTLAYRGADGPELRYKPVVVTRFEPKPRVY